MVARSKARDQEVWGYVDSPSIFGWLEWMYKNFADGFEIAVNAVLMGADRTSIHKPQYCLTGTGWEITSSELTTLPISQPRPYALPVMKLGLRRDVPASNGELARWHGFYVYWFVADGQLTADHHERMWWMARDLVRTGLLQRWAYIACLVVCPPGREAPTYDRLAAFLQAAVPEFQLTAGSGAAATPK